MSDPSAGRLLRLKQSDFFGRDGCEAVLCMIATRNRKGSIEAEGGTHWPARGINRLRFDVQCTTPKALTCDRCKASVPFMLCASNHDRVRQASGGFVIGKELVIHIIWGRAGHGMCSV